MWSPTVMRPSLTFFGHLYHVLVAVYVGNFVANAPYAPNRLSSILIYSFDSPLICPYTHASGLSRFITATLIRRKISLLANGRRHYTLASTTQLDWVDVNATIVQLNIGINAVQHFTTLTTSKMQVDHADRLKWNIESSYNGLRIP